MPKIFNSHLKIKTILIFIYNLLDRYFYIIEKYLSILKSVYRIWSHPIQILKLLASGKDRMTNLLIYYLNLIFSWIFYVIGFCLASGLDGIIEKQN
jgi:hypothetical protein